MISFLYSTIGIAIFVTLSISLIILGIMGWLQKQRPLIYCGIAGVIIIIIYLVIYFVFKPPDKISEQLNRSEFLQERSKSLDNVTLFLQLKQGYTMEELGHFRAVFEIIDLNQSPDHAILRFTVRDAYTSDYLIGGRSIKQHGIKTILRSYNPDEELQNTMISIPDSTRSQIVSTGGVRDRGPFQTIEDFDKTYINIYLTESLLGKIEYIGFAANNYVLFGLPIDCLDTLRIEDISSIDWPEDLSGEEKKIGWFKLQTKRYWPSDDTRPPLRPPLKIDFEKYTPVKEKNIDTIRKGWDPVTVPTCDFSKIYPPH